MCSSGRPLGGKRQTGALRPNLNNIFIWTIFHDFYTLKKGVADLKSSFLYRNLPVLGEIAFFFKETETSGNIVV